MKTPFVYLAISLSLGICLAGFFAQPLIVIFAMSAISAVSAFVLLRRKAVSHLCLYLAIFFLGVLSFRASGILPSDHLLNLADGGCGKISVKGVVADDPSTARTFYNSYRTTFTLRACSCKTQGAWHKASGLVKVDVYTKNPKNGIAYGDELEAEGTLSRIRGLKNPGLFDHSRYLGLGNVYLRLKADKGSPPKVTKDPSGISLRAKAYNFRHKTTGIISDNFDEPYSGFLKAVLIGDRSGLDNKLRDDFMKTGTIHILSVSGTHVALIACLLIFLFRLLRIPKKGALAIAAFLLVFYSFAAGLNPPIVRSVIMFAIFALGYILDRESGLLNSLAVAALLILMWNPKELFDPGFQLSFGSIASIAILAPLFDRLLGIEMKGRLSRLDKAKFWLLKSLSVSAAAWIGVAPIVSFYFNIASPIAVLANLLVVPAVSLIMAASIILLPLAALSAAFAVAAAVIIQPACAMLFSVNHLFAILPMAYFRIPAPSPAFFTGYYLLVGLMVAPKPIRLGRARIEWKHILILALVMVNIFVWRHCLYAERKTLDITFLDVGSGDAILVEFPKKGVMLIDAGRGGDPDRFDAGRSIVAPYLWNSGIRRIDALVVTHSHEDHLGGVPYLLQNFDIGCVLDNGEGSSAKTMLAGSYRDSIKKKNLHYAIIHEGDSIGGFPGIRALVLSPSRAVEAKNANETSIVLKITYGRSSALLCGDISGQALDSLIDRGECLRSDILKVPHHGGSLGSKNSAIKLFDAVSPKACVVSCGEEVRPNTTVSELLKSSNFISYETKKDGAVKVFLDGKSLQVKRYGGKN